MGLFDRLQDEIDERERQAGVSPMDVLDLSRELRDILSTLTRSGGMTRTEVAQSTGLSAEEALSLLESLESRGFVSAEGEGDGAVYKRLFGHRRRREIPIDIWQALADRVDEEDTTK